MISLDLEIQRESNRLVDLVSAIPLPHRILKNIDGTGGKISVTDLLAYQIGWGRSLIRWYEAGIQNDVPQMPGDGFLTWNYVAIAQHFYQKYRYDAAEKQLLEFHQVISRILDIVRDEMQSGNLERIGVWSWCTLSSGKEWPLSKWVRVNTVSPYRRASQLLRRGHS